MYLATKPPALVMTSAQQRWYARTSSRMSSGSSRIESAVEPTRSQNMMVSWRRSAADPVSLAGLALAAMGGLDAIVLAGTLVPHSEQKPSSGGTPCPHFGQARGRATPHLPQNLLPSTTSTPHPGHCKGPHPPPRISSSV